MTDDELRKLNFGDIFNKTRHQKYVEHVEKQFNVVDDKVAQIVTKRRNRVGDTLLGLALIVVAIPTLTLAGFAFGVASVCEIIGDIWRMWFK